MKKFTFLLVFSTIAFFAIAQTGVDSPSLILVEAISGLELPKAGDNDMIIEHSGYTLCYDTMFRQARWVAYELTTDELNSVVKRSDNFKQDPLLTCCSASNNDYLNSGYDKGHLAPAADMEFSEVTMRESFYLSNISPQVPSLNRGLWKKLEEMVREWAKVNVNIYIATGGILTKDMKTIGRDRVAVPKYFYKVIIDYTNPEYKGIGFIMPNSEPDKPIQWYAVPIDSVEKVTGINFFYQLPDKEEKMIEGSIDLTKWNLK